MCDPDIISSFLRTTLQSKHQGLFCPKKDMRSREVKRSKVTEQVVEFVPGPDSQVHVLSVEGDLKTSSLDPAERKQAWAREEGTVACSSAYLGGIFLPCVLQLKFCCS